MTILQYVIHMVINGYSVCRKIRNLKDSEGYGVMLELKDGQLMRIAYIQLYNELS